jgi:DUF4097 and DUF4098 domain-containing protein YvlB
MNRTLARTAPLAALLVAIALAPPARAETATERFEKTIEVPSGVEIALRNTNGGIEVTTWDRDAVEIVAEKTARSRDGGSAREALEAIEILVDQADGRLTIETDLPTGSTGVMSWLFGRHVDASVAYELKVPVSSRLDVRTVNGSVRSEGPGGEQVLRSTNGRITVEAAGGSVEAHTTNGSIDVALVAGATGADIDASTTNGSITLHVPADVRGRLEARTVNGSVRTEIPVKIQGTVSKRRMDAELNGGGDVRIGLRTVNGSIRVLES